MNILVVSQYFWPENFRINDLCKELSDRGHNITVLTGYPNYPDGEVFPDFKNNRSQYSSFSGIDVVRVPIVPRKNSTFFLLMNYISFFISGIVLGRWKLRKKNFDLIFCCQLSPITAALPAIYMKRKRKIPLVLWSLDLWPESLVVAGQIKSKSILSIVSKLVSFIYSQCDLILGQSNSYLTDIKKRDRSGTKVGLFPNWAEDLFEIPYEIKSNKNRMNILFAGNLGEAQDLGVIVKAAEELNVLGQEVHFTIVGGGRRKEWMEGEVNRLNLSCFFTFYGQLPLSDMPKFYSMADIALVSLTSNYIFDRTIPGKVQSYMVAGLPVLSTVSGECKNLITNARCGLSSNSSDVRELVNNIIKLNQMSYAELKSMGENGKNYAKENFSRFKLVNDLEASFNNLVNGLK